MTARFQRVVLACLASALTIVVLGGCAEPRQRGVLSPSSTPRSRAIDASETLQSEPATAAPMTFAVIGDYGTDDEHEKAVAQLVASWDPQFVITTGDDYYRSAGGKGSARYDESTGAHYARWLSGITTDGDRAPTGLAATNAFFPALGNHDYSDATPSLETYLAYFDLPGEGFESSSGNERYYDFVYGPVHFFVLNSNDEEPDGTSRDSKQARWLEKQLAASASAWNIVYDHHPPYSSDDRHGSSTGLRWPFAEWGADAVLSGHAHTYERVMESGVPYFVNGLGGAGRYGFERETVAGSAVRYREDWGAQRVTVTPDSMFFEFINTQGRVVDRYELRAD